MNTSKIIPFAATIAVVVALGLFVYLVKASRALSYLSTDPKACINCHVMNTQYATWQHSSHARHATCVDCHLPHDSVVNKYLAKSRDGWNHATAFTLNTYQQRMQISADAAKRVQANCIACHAKVVGTILANRDRFHQYNNPQLAEDVRCWDCHRDVPHGRGRNLASTQYNLGVRELK